MKGNVLFTLCHIGIVYAALPPCVVQALSKGLVSAHVQCLVTPESKCETFLGRHPISKL